MFARRSANGGGAVACDTSDRPAGEAVVRSHDKLAIEMPGGMAEHRHDDRQSNEGRQ